MDLRMSGMKSARIERYDYNGVDDLTWTNLLGAMYSIVFIVIPIPIVFELIIGATTYPVSPLLSLSTNHLIIITPLFWPGRDKHFGALQQKRQKPVKKTEEIKESTYCPITLAQPLTPFRINIILLCDLLFYTFLFNLLFRLCL